MDLEIALRKCKLLDLCTTLNWSTHRQFRVKISSACVCMSDDFLLAFSIRISDSNRRHLAIAVDCGRSKTGSDRISIAESITQPLEIDCAYSVCATVAIGASVEGVAFAGI